MSRPPGWYPGPGLYDGSGSVGSVLRWWTGDAWGPQVAELDSDPPPPARPWSARAPTAALTLPATSVLPAH